MAERQLSSERDQQIKVQTIPYGPFKLIDQENAPPKSVLEIQGEMGTRKLSNIGLFNHNQNYSFLKSNGQYPSRMVDSKVYYQPLTIPIVHSKENQLQSLKGVAKDREKLLTEIQPKKPEYIKENNAQTAKFNCKSCILIVVSLLILAVLAGFFFLIMKNQLEQAKYFALTNLNLWHPNQPEIFQGSAQGSHSVKDTSKVIVSKGPSPQPVPATQLKKDQDKTLAVTQPQILTSNVILKNDTTKKQALTTNTQTSLASSKPVASRISPTQITSSKEVPSKKSSSSIQPIQTKTVNPLQKKITHRSFNTLRHYSE